MPTIIPWRKSHARVGRAVWWRGARRDRSSCVVVLDLGRSDSTRRSRPRLLATSLVVYLCCGEVGFCAFRGRRPALPLLSERASGAVLRKVVELSNGRPSDSVDERAWETGKFLDLPPLADDNLEYLELAERALARDDDMSTTSSPYFPLLGRSLADPAISGDDDEATLRDQGNPILVWGLWIDVARRSLAVVDDATRVTWIGDIGPDHREEMCEAECVGVDVEAESRWLWLGHLGLRSRRLRSTPFIRQGGAQIRFAESKVCGDDVEVLASLDELGKILGSNARHVR